MTGEEEVAAKIMARAAEGTIEIINAIRSAVREEGRLGNAPKE